jgi:lipopolysaccharide/colanic/teichoic acid biosynthesis glycosyltransferase
MVLSLGMPVLILHRKNGLRQIWWNVLRGSASVVGLLPDGIERTSGKLGVTGLAQVSRNAHLSKPTIQQLNDYYVRDYSLSLDIEIILKQLIRRNRG